MKGDIKKQPLWVQVRLESLEIEIKNLNRKLETVQNMNAIMCEPKRDWFTLPFSFDNYDRVNLWILNKDNPFSVCTLGKGDTIFIGRAKPEAQQQ